MNDPVRQRVSGLLRAILGAATLGLLVSSPACGSRARPDASPSRAAVLEASAPATRTVSVAPLGPHSPAPADPPESLLRWAGDEPTAIVVREGALIARALDSGRTRTLRADSTQSALLDPALDLLWIQGPTTLDVLDLRAGGAPVPIAIALPVGPRIQVDRDLDGKQVHLASPDVCIQASDLFLDWTAEPHVQLIGGDPEEEKRATDPAALVGRAWLRAQAGRVAHRSPPERRDFSSAKPAPAVARAGLTCSTTEECGRAIPFDGSGRLLVVVEHSLGDCHHYGCRLYEPATHRFATPPAAAAWGTRAGGPTGPCGLYRFDRSGRRFLAGDQVCAVGGACEDLGGDAKGWLVPGADVGTNG
jgi:hypothetical protein